MNDTDNKIPSILLSSMIRSSKENFDALEGLENRLDPKRLGRKNTTCFFSCNLEIIQSYLNQKKFKDNPVVLFPSIAEELPIYQFAAKWPEKGRQEVLFDLRDSKKFNSRSAFNQQDVLWEETISQPQLIHEHRTQSAVFESSVHYIKHCDVILIIHTTTRIDDELDPGTGQQLDNFRSENRIVFEFFDPYTLKKLEKNSEYFIPRNNDTGFNKKTKHLPITIEQESFNCAFVAEDLSKQRSIDSFLVVLGHYNQTSYKNRWYSPKLLKFVKIGTYWKTAEYEFSDLTNFKGLTFDEFRSKKRTYREAFRNHLKDPD